MVVFSSPQWLFLIPVFLVTGWFWKGLRLWRPLRGLCLLFLVLVLALTFVQARLGEKRTHYA